MDRPVQFKVHEGLFFEGHILVEAPDEKAVGFTANRPGGEVWLPYAIDLRRVTEIKQRTPTDPCAVLYTADGFLGTVSPTVADIMPHWAKARLTVKQP